MFRTCWFKKRFSIPLYPCFRNTLTLLISSVGVDYIITLCQFIGSLKRTSRGRHFDLKGFHLLDISIQPYSYCAFQHLWDSRCTFLILRLGSGLSLLRVSLSSRGFKSAYVFSSLTHLYPLYVFPQPQTTLLIPDNLNPVLRAASPAPA